MVRGRSLHVKSISHVGFEGKAKIFVVVSGKGGVGKTNFALNLGIQLATRRINTVLVDADFGRVNSNVLMHIPSERNEPTSLSTNDIESLLQPGPGGMRVLAGVPGAENAEGENDPLACVQIIERLEDICDAVIVDCGAGLSFWAQSFALLSDRLVLLTTPEPTSLADTYAVLKMMHLRGFSGAVGVVANMATRREADETIRRLQRVSERFLGRSVENYGFVPLDRHVQRAVMKRVPVLLRYPRCAASLSISQIGYRVMTDGNVEKSEVNVWGSAAGLFL